jgi:hypothetical protein
MTTKSKAGGEPAMVEASTSHLERAREPGVKYAPLLPGVHKSGTINMRFLTLINIKIAENAVVSIKSLNKNYKMFCCEAYKNFLKLCYFRHSYVITTQSFGSHIYPHATRLGLTPVYT